jgi:hypothetical protein
MQLRALAVAAGLFWPVSADAQAAVSYLETGNMLYVDCSTSMGRTACINYVMGVTDALSLMGTICTPEPLYGASGVVLINPPCPLYPRKRTWDSTNRDVPLCAK